MIISDTPAYYLMEIITPPISGSLGPESELIHRWRAATDRTDANSVMGTPALTWITLIKKTDLKL